MIKLGVIMDPIQKISPAKDTTFALLLAAQAKGWQIYYMEPQDLFLNNDQVSASMQRLTLRDQVIDWYMLETQSILALKDLDCVLMRKDPPIDQNYFYLTYLLELAQTAGAFILNDPRGLRDVNEKLFTTWFPQCCPPFLVTQKAQSIKDFLATHHDIILKPLGGMGGDGIFRLQRNDPNLNAIIETVTHYENNMIMVQQYIPQITYGDKRILLINGQPVEYALARFAAPGETRANLAKGGHGIAQALSDRDKWICQQVAPLLLQKGLIFVGLDIIGDYLTEINVTSPTGIRELDHQCDLSISDRLLDYIANHLTSQ